VTFAESAKNRESVMCLGSIAHLQYYFARTGLLDGKGGQMAKTKQNGEHDIPRLSLSGSEVVESPIEEEGQLLWEAAKEDGEAVMLPPTVSTYSHRDHYIPPPPDQKSLKKDLVEALEVALHAIEDTVPSKNSVPKDGEEDEPTQGFYEIQGLHILDTTTLAIRAARLYYAMHPNPARLNSIKSDHQLRRDLMNVLDVLKRWAGRKFTGGLREEERLAILVWVSDVGMMIDQETKMEDAERQEREGWKWMDDSEWVGKDELRELSFLESLLHDTGDDGDSLPQWTPSSHEHAQTDFLRSLADGRQLVRMHNAAVKRSKKQFGHITTHHIDVAKPYRRAENLRFWIKAADIRWEVKLNLDVMAIVNASQDPQVWRLFEDAIFSWSGALREEVTRDWKTDEERKLHARAKSLALASPASSPKKKSAEFHPESPLAA
jgi:hypothetical protein